MTQERIPQERRFKNLPKIPDWLVAALESCICSGKGDDCSFSLYILPYLYYILFPLKKRKMRKDGTGGVWQRN